MPLPKREFSGILQSPVESKIMCQRILLKNTIRRHVGVVWKRNLRMSTTFDVFKLDKPVRLAAAQYRERMLGRPKAASL